MDNYPTLVEMGVKNPHQIARYSVYESDHTDHLRISYNRQKGSMLPESRKYVFPRMRKTVLVDSGTRQTETIYESSAILAKAVTELDDIVSRHEGAEEIKRVVLEELHQLEREVRAHAAYIESLMRKI